MKNPDREFWNQRYAEAQTGWDIGYPSPALKLYIDGLPDKNQKILIPGCGNAYEAGYLLQQGFTNITLIDIAPLVVDRVSVKFEAEIKAGILRIICGDFFELNESFNLILEQTFFCAISPTLRKNYVQKVYELLSAGGLLAGLLFDKTFEGGPPFGGNSAEYEELFKPVFGNFLFQPCHNSILPRRGAEIFITVRKA